MLVGHCRSCAEILQIIIYPIKFQFQQITTLLNCMRQMDVEMVKIRTTINLKKINIAVRFPCSISFALKDEDSVVQHNGFYELLNGLSIINQKIETEVEIGHANGKYAEKQIQLLLYMISTNGKIPAGTVTINPVERVLTDRKVPIQKCPDKGASASYTLNFQKVQSFHDSRMKFKPLRQPAYSEYHNQTLQKSKMSKNSNQFLFKSQVEGLQNDPSQASFTPSENKLSSIRGTNQKHYQDKWASVVTSQIDMEARSPKYNDQFSRKSIIGALSRDQSDFHLSRASIRLTETDQSQLHTQRNRISRLQQQKAYYILQLSKLEGSQKDSSDRIEFGNKINKIQTQKQQLEDQIEKLKDKLRHHERTEKESVNQIKELREQLDKRKSKLSQLDGAKNQVQSKIVEKDKCISQLEKEKKRLEQLLQQNRALQVSAQKKIELKENSFREQLKKINEKYIQSETEKQRSIIQHSNTLGQLEAAQKSFQLTLRQKQKMFCEQKNKLNKKIQSLDEINSSIKQHLNEDKMTIVEMKQLLKKSVDQLKNWQQRLKVEVQKNQKLDRGLKNMQQENNLLKDQIAQLKLQFYEDKSNYKKKYVQATNQINLQNDKIHKIHSINLMTEAKVREQSQKLEKQIKQKNTMKQRLAEFKKIEQKYIQQQSNRQRIAENLSNQNINQIQKVAELKNTLSYQKEKYNTMEKTYEEQVKCLLKSKEYIQNQVEQLRQQLQKQSVKYEVIRAKSNEQNKQIMRLSQQLMKIQQNMTKNVQTMQQKDIRILELMEDIAALQLKYKEVNQIIKKREQEVHQMEKSNNQYKEAIIIQSAISKKNNQHLQLQIQLLQKDLKLRKSQIQVKDQVTFALKKQTNQQKDQIHLLNKTLSTKNHQLLAVSDICKKVSQDYSLLVIKYQKIKDQVKIKAQNIEQLEFNIYEKDTRLSECLKQQEQLRHLLQSYKIEVNKALMQLLTQLSVGDTDKFHSRSFKSCPDENLSIVLMNCIKQHQAIVKKYKQQLLNKSNSIDFVEQQLKKQQINMEKIQILHEQQIEKEKDKLKCFVSEQEKEMNELKHKNEEQLQRSSDYLSQIDYLNSQNNKFEDEIQELNRKIKVHQQKNRELKHSNSQMQRQINYFKAKQLKDALVNRDSYEQLNVFYSNQINSNKITILSLQEENKLKEHNINSNIQIIKRLNQNQEVDRLEKLQIIQQLSQITLQANQQNNKRLISQKQLKDSEKIIREISEELQYCRQQTNRYRQRELTYQNQIIQLKEQANINEHRYIQIKNQQQSEKQTLLEREKRQIDKSTKIDLLKTKLEQQNKSLRERCIKFQNQVEFYKFYNIENTKKIEQYENTREQAKLELLKYKQNLLKSQGQKNDLQNKWYQFEMQVENVNKQKVMMAHLVANYEDKIADLSQKNEIYQQQLALQSQKYQDIEKLRQMQDFKDQLYENQVTELKMVIQQSNKQLKACNNFIRELERRLQEYPDLSLEQTKWEIALINARQQLKSQKLKMEETISILKEQLSFQNEQFTQSIEVTNQTIRQLDQLSRQKQQKLQIKQQEINQQLICIDELNIQLNECILKWQKERQAYLPTSNRMSELNEDINRMNKFIIELDGRNKQLLQINKRKVQQKIEAKNSITEMLKQVLLLLQKSKGKILGRCKTDKQKEQVIQQFKVVMNKLDTTLKSTQVAIIVKQQ